jgi:DNA-binding NarL/FixJ family response regulator
MTALTPREHLVLRLMWEGLRYREIARAMDLSPKMVGQVRRSLGLKLHATTGPHVMRRALEHGVIQL